MSPTYVSAVLYKRTVVDPRGKVWVLRFEGGILPNEKLRRAIERHSREPTPRSWWQDPRYGLPNTRMGCLRLIPRGRWEREHSYVRLVLARTDGPPPEEHRWISPGDTRVQARADLDDIANRIERGEPIAG
jgi:hypothetical protein